MRSGGWVLRFLFGAVIFWGFIWLLVAEILANHTTETTKVIIPSPEISKQHHARHQDIDINNVSKRRVPNGPDPIHNRRASKSRQPPGQV